jgi:hypothetical protein
MDIASIALTRSTGTTVSRRRFTAVERVEREPRLPDPHLWRGRWQPRATGRIRRQRRSGLRAAPSLIAVVQGGSVDLHPQLQAAAVASPAVAAAVDSQAVALAVVVATQVGPAVVAATRAAAADADNLPVEFDYAARGKSRLIRSLDYCAVLAWHPKQSPYAGSICCDRE